MEDLEGWILLQSWSGNTHQEVAAFPQPRTWRTQSTQVKIRSKPPPPAKVRLPTATPLMETNFARPQMMKLAPLMMKLAPLMMKLAPLMMKPARPITSQSSTPSAL